MPGFIWEEKRWEESRFHSIWPSYFHRGLCERQISWERRAEGGGISCLLKCDRIVTEVKIRSMLPSSLRVRAGIGLSRLQSADELL